MINKGLRPFFTVGLEMGKLTVTKHTRSKRKQNTQEQNSLCAIVIKTQGTSSIQLRWLDGLLITYIKSHAATVFVPVPSLEERPVPYPVYSFKCKTSDVVWSTLL